MTALGLARLRERRLARSHELGLALACFVGSAATVQKYAGTGATVAYLAVLLVALPWILRAAEAFAATLSPRTIAVLALAVLLVLAAAFFIVYPHANTHAPNAGSDRDDAADLGGHAILSGSDPYAGRTYLGNTVSQFPGLLLLGVPFVALGHSAYAFLFWLPVLFAMLWRLRGEPRRPLVLIGLALVVSPVLVREIVTGGDLIANTVSVMVAGTLVVLALGRASPAWTWAAALGLGLTLSSRLNFVFVVPPLLAVAWSRRGTGAALSVGVGALVGFVGVTLPFYLWHGHSFPPISASNKLVAFNGSVPGGERAVIAAGIVLSVLLVLRASTVRLRDVFAQTAIVQAFFLVAIVLLASVNSDSFDLVSLTPGYGLTVLLLAVGAVALDRVGEGPA